MNVRNFVKYREGKCAKYIRLKFNNKRVERKVSDEKEPFLNFIFFFNSPFLSQTCYNVYKHDVLTDTKRASQKFYPKCDSNKIAGLSRINYIEGPIWWPICPQQKLTLRPPELGRIPFQFCTASLFPTKAAVWTSTKAMRDRKATTE